MKAISVTWHDAIAFREWLISTLSEGEATERNSGPTKREREIVLENFHADNSTKWSDARGSLLSAVSFAADAARPD
jgi:hypothetical protein